MDRPSDFQPAPGASTAVAATVPRHLDASGGFAAVAFVTAFTVALGGCTKPLAGDAPADAHRFASGGAGQSTQESAGRQDTYLPARFPPPVADASGNVTTFERD